jgi:hypothetical protein
MRCASDSWPNVPDWTDPYSHEAEAITLQQAKDMVVGVAMLGLIYELVKPRPAQRRWWRP